MARTTPRLIDIAERAELSVTSISRILSGQRLSEYSPATQKRVRKIAEELGWRPNLVVQGMKTGKTHTYGVFMAPYDTFWTGVLYGVHDTLLDAKQVPLVLWPHALVHPTVEPWEGDDWVSGTGSAPYTPNTGANETRSTDDGSSRRELDRINCLEDRRVDAIISWPLHEQNARERLSMLSDRGLPVVTIDDALPGSAKSIYVGSDEDSTMGKIRKFFGDLGHVQVLYVGLKREHAWARRRRDAFFAAWPEVDRALAVELAEDDDRCHDQVVACLKQHPKATAIIAATDHVARHVVRAASKIGKEVPRDFSIIGYGNDLFGKGDIPLTTIDQRPYEVGQAAAQVTLDLGKKKTRSVLVPTQLLVRESTRALSS